MPISNNKVILKNSTDLNSRQKVTPKYFVKLRCFFILQYILLTGNLLMT